MQDRKKIVKIITGSNLYGTNRPDSDIDYAGVFLPSHSDLLGLQNCPTEMSENKKISSGLRNIAGDIDCKYYSLKQFFNLAGEGQPGQLELLFAPQSHTEFYSSEWKIIKLNRDIFLSRKSITPFIGFAIAQAHKASIKGDNLNALRGVQEWGKKLTSEQANYPLSKYLISYPESTVIDNSTWIKGRCAILNLADHQFDLKKNDHGFLTFRVAGRQFDPGTKTKTFLKAVEGMTQRYGTRSEAAAKNKHDYKSIMHAYRLLFEAEEFLKTGQITLPRPRGECEFLREILDKETNPGKEFDWNGDLNAMADRLRNDILPRSVLPKTANWSMMEKLCVQLLYDHINSVEKSWFRKVFQRG